MMNFRHGAWPALLTAAAFGLLAETGAASTCKDELDRFQSELYGSTLATRKPQLFEELVRETERTAELRDEQRCLERVAELRESLQANKPAEPTAAPAEPTAGDTSSGASDSEAAASRPKPPVLLVADGDGADGNEPQPSGADDDELEESAGHDGGAGRDN